MTPGSIYSKKQYIEYQPGSLNVIISVPHGGSLKPDSIPDRDAGYLVDGKRVYDHKTTTKDHENCPIQRKCDMNTVPLSLKLTEELKDLTGAKPHIIINRLSRVKLDANRDIDIATFNIPDAVEAWRAYHEFIDQAKGSIRGPALVLDIHGQSHPEELVELGYLLSARQLDCQVYSYKDTSVAHLTAANNMDIRDVIVGPKSFGSLLSAEGYLCVPSPVFPSILGKHYYSGGYNTIRHGSLSGGKVDAIQIEIPKIYRQQHAIPAFAKALARVTKTYIDLYTKPT